MDWQQATALGIVAVTAAALLICWVRRRRMPFRTGSGCGCGCPGSGTLRARDSIVYRARKGERPEILVRPTGR